MKKFLILLACFGLFGLTTELSAQGGSSGNPLQFQATSYDSVQVQFTWVTPSNAIACTIEYNTHYATTQHVIQNFPLNGGSIPRATPIGPVEEFVIHFQLAAGQGIVTDTTIFRHVYGGVVLVEEDVFCSPVFSGCVGTGTLYYFVNECIVAEFSAVCPFALEYREPYMDAFGDDWITEMDSFLFTSALISHLNAGLPDPYSGVYTCDYLDDLILATVVEGRKGIASEVQPPQYQAAPNPFSQQLRITSATEIGSQPLRVRDILGRTILQREVSFENAPEGYLIRTKDWDTGLYFVEIGEGVNRQTLKVLKQ